MLTLDKIYHASFVLKSVARKTDLIASPHLCEGLDPVFKDREFAGNRQLQAERRILQN